MNVPFSPRDVASLRMKLHVLHGQLANTTNPIAMGSLLRQYIAATDSLYLFMKNGLEKPALSTLQSAVVASPFVPGGAVISAAITGTSNYHSSSGA